MTTSRGARTGPGRASATNGVTLRSPGEIPGKKGTSRDVSEDNRCRSDGHDACRGIPAPGIAEGAEAQPTIARRVIPRSMIPNRTKETRFQPLPNAEAPRNRGWHECDSGSIRSLLWQASAGRLGGGNVRCHSRGDSEPFTPCGTRGNDALREPRCDFRDRNGTTRGRSGRPRNRDRQEKYQKPRPRCQATAQAPPGDAPAGHGARSTRRSGKEGETGKRPTMPPAKSMQFDAWSRPIEPEGPAKSRADAGWPPCPGAPLPCSATRDSPDPHA